MHKFKTVQILNVFDISLANYLISGGNKPEIYDDCSRFVEIYKEQENRDNLSEYLKVLEGIYLEV